MSGEPRIHARKVEMVAVGTLKPDPKNARTHPEEQLEKLEAIIRNSGFTTPLLIDTKNSILAGHGRWMVAQRLGMAEVPCVRVTGLSKTQLKALKLSDNQIGLLSGWDEDILREELLGLQSDGFDLGLTGFDVPDDEPEEQKKASGSLAAKFGVAPFSVLNAREGWWQDRKRAWLDLGIRSEVGRGENLLQMSDTMLEPDPVKRAAMQAAAGKGKARTFGQDLMRGEHVVGQGKRAGLTWGMPPATDRKGDVNPVEAARLEREGRKPSAAPAAGGGGKGVWVGDQPGGKKPRGLAVGTQEWVQRKIAEGDIEGGMAGNQSGTSIFDPVLCELAYRWFCPPGGQIIDPFAGGSVRGIVAAKLGRRYFGVDLREEQIEANRLQAQEICPDGLAPEWAAGDSCDLPGHAGDRLADFIFSCPPYADLEVYSDDPRDLSTMAYAEFRRIYFEIVAHSIALLKPDRFACFVVGDVRDERGAYRGFVRDTELAFEAAGARLYNECILVTACGSLAMRASRAFEATRKLGKTHQNVLVFVKGDARRATEAIGAVEFGDPVEAAEIADAGGQAPPPAADSDGDDSMFGEVL